MKTKKKLLAVMLCVIAMFSMTVALFAAENKDGYTEKDGVVFETTTDKDTYVSGDTAKFSVKVTNTNDYDIKDLSIIYTIPSNFDIAQADMPKTIDALEAGASTTLSFETKVTSDTKAPVNVTMIVIIAVVAVVVVAAVVVIIVIAKKKKTSSLMLVAVLLAGSLASVASAPVDVQAEVTNADYKRVSVHDPSIVKDPETGTYYVFGSHKAWAKSDDLISWTTFTTNINTDYTTLFGDVWDKYSKTPENPDLNGNLWAPDVIYNETMGKWCMYMSVNGSNHQSVIVLLTADNIEGPYEYVGGVMYSGFHNGSTLNQSRAEYSDIYQVLGDGADLSRYNNTNSCKVNAIDPNVEYDQDGNLWMTYGSWSAGIWQIKLDSTTGLRDYNYTYENVSGKSDPYLGYKISGGYYNSGEGPYILHMGDYYYLFVSIGNLEASGGYNMRVYRSESINGPFVDENGKSAISTSWSADLGYKEDGQNTGSWVNTSKYTSPIGIKLMGAYNMYGISRVQVAQGHNSAFVDEDGKAYVIYHSRFAGGGEGHEVRVHQLFQTEDGWLVAAPYEYSGETLSTDGYDTADVAGTYDFILHRQDLVYAANATPNEGETYFLNSSKTITVNSEEVTLGMRVDWVEDNGKVTDSKGVVYAMDVTLNEDGTISGDYTGEWEFTTGSNVKMTIDGVEYTGVFIEQQNEITTRDMTMTFTLVGGNNCAWGVKNPEKN